MKTCERCGKPSGEDAFCSRECGEATYREHFRAEQYALREPLKLTITAEHCDTEDENGQPACKCGHGLGALKPHLLHIGDEAWTCGECGEIAGFHCWKFKEDGSEPDCACPCRDDDLW